MSFQLVILFSLNAMSAMAPLGFRSRVGRIACVIAVAFALTNIDFNHRPSVAPGWTIVALPMISALSIVTAFVAEFVFRWRSALAR